MKNSKQAMITVEATLVLPIFIFVVYFFLYFYQILMMQEVIHVNATKVAKEVSSYGIVTNLFMKQTAAGEEEKFSGIFADKEDSFLSDIVNDIDFSTISGNTIDSLYFSNRLSSYLEDMSIVQRCIDGGYNGILFYGSSIFDEEECVTITLTYQIKFPVFQKILPKLPVIQTVRMRSFNGYAVESKAQTVEDENKDEEENEEEMVYITENGDVYHTNKSCTYLKISVMSCSSINITSRRNNSGAKYYACERCFHNGDITPETLYITANGNRYHKNASCTAISRKILTVPISEVTNRRLCKRCQQYH